MQEDLLALCSKVAVLQERDVDTARGLEVARNLSARIEEAEARGAELAAKLAAVGGTMPLLTGQVKGVEKKVGGPRAGRHDAAAHRAGQGSGEEGGWALGWEAGHVYVPRGRYRVFGKLQVGREHSR